MAYALVQEAHDFTFTTAVKAYPGNVTAGNLLIAWLENAVGGTPTISDTLGNTWSSLHAGANFSAGYGAMQAWYAIANSSSADTVTFASPNAFPLIQIAEFSGNAPSSVSDTFNQGTGSGVTLSRNIATSFSDELVIGIGIPTGGVTLMTPGDGWTAWSGTGGYNAVYSVQASPGTYTPTIIQNASGAWGIIVAAFKAPTVATAKPVIIILQ